MTAARHQRAEGEDPPEGSAPTLRDLVTSRRTQFALLLYILFPLFSGFVSAMQGAGRTSGWPIEFRFAYYLPLALVVMWSSGLVCHLISRPARAIRLPLWLLLIAGSMLAGEIIKMYVRLVVPIFDKLLPVTAIGGRVADFDFLASVQSGVPTILTWLCINLLAWRVFGIPRFGYVAPPSMVSASWSRTEPLSQPDGAVRNPNFLSRANLGGIDNVEAIEAQQHYIKLHSPSGSRTILYRFGDAISELRGDDGLQVHRSWWVNRDHVSKLEKEGERLELVMSSGLVVPVSRSYAVRTKREFA